MVGIVVEETFFGEELLLKVENKLLEGSSGFLMGGKNPRD